MIGVAISGKAAAGKTTLASHIVHACDEEDIPVVRIGFADALKEEVRQKYGIDKSMVGGRDALIRHGTAMRDKDKEYWIRPVREKTMQAVASGQLVVIDDLRFLNEFYWASWAGFVTVKMVATAEWRTHKLLQQGLSSVIVASLTPSETELDATKHMYTIRNSAYARLPAAATFLLGELRG
jgi:KaiC/GvpD/RAD55 family RecA-like ATPase